MGFLGSLFGGTRAPVAIDGISLRGYLVEAARRAQTGTLHCEFGGHVADLYMLFGHVYHATTDESEGDVAIARTLGWPMQGVRMTFDKRAKLPAKETVGKDTAARLADGS